MLSISKELKNIPVSISILHEQEYNLCLLLKINKTKPKKRRAFSEKLSIYDENNKDNKKFLDERRQTLKNYKIG
jgi:hypothetical protein